MTQINNLEDIVKNGLCIGCGLCQSITGKDSIEISMSSKGILEPHELKKIPPLQNTTTTLLPWMGNNRKNTTSIHIQQ